MSLLMDALKKAAQSKQQQNHHVANASVEHEINVNVFTDGNAALSLDNEQNHLSVQQDGDVSELLLDSEALEKELASIMAGSHAQNESIEIENSLGKKVEDHLVGNHLSLQLNLIDDHTIQESSSTVSGLMMADDVNDGLSFTVIEDAGHNQIDTHIMPVFGEDTTAESTPLEDSSTHAVPLPVENALALHHNHNEKNEVETKSIEVPQGDKKTKVMADPAGPIKRATADRLLQAGKQPAATQKNNYRLYGLLVSLIMAVIGLGGGYVYYELNASSFTPGLALPTAMDLKNRAPLLAVETIVDAQAESPLTSSQTEESLQEHRSVESIQPKKVIVVPKKISPKISTPRQTITSITPKTVVRQSTSEVSTAKKSSPKQTAVTPDQKTTSKKSVSAVVPKIKRREQHIADSAAATHSIKNESVDSTHQLLLNGYNAYQRGDDVTARRSYLAVLQRENKNRDAMLGLAAIALREKNYVIAQDYYTRLLRVNSSDNVARGGLVSLLGELAPLQAESELKVLLSEDSGAAYLHFVLGNIYVSQSRWADAQQAFFKSYSADSSNADYAYNLAVSLDFLGEHKAALSYYREALILAERKTVSFDLSAVKNRIHRLLRIVGGSFE